jgi:hypothetical protein
VNSGGLEQIVLFAVFVLIALLNLVLGWVRRRAAAEPAADASTPAPRAPAPRMPPARRAAPGVRPSETVPAGPVRAPARAPTRPASRRGLRSGGPRDLRRAIVLMAVLGPCRGLEPPL